MVKEEVILRISSKKDSSYVKKVAGAISWQLRENGYCKARAVKADAVNTAIKAVAIVNDRVSQAGMAFVLDLFFSPADSGKQKNASTAIEIMIHELDEEESSRPDEFVEYKVSGKKNDTDASKRLAVAISSRSNEKTGVRLRCIGPTSVYCAIKACCLAKGYVYPNGLQSIVVPLWSKLILPDDSIPVSFIQIDFWTRKLPS
jgi:stage V sporulation protein SpoVS